MMLRYMRMPAWQSWGLALPGAGLCVLIALAASFVAGLHGGPSMLYALLFGTALHYLHAEVRTAPGVRMASRMRRAASSAWVSNHRKGVILGMTSSVAEP